MRAHVQIFLTGWDKAVPAAPLPNGHLRVKLVGKDGTCELTGPREAMLELAGAILALTHHPELIEAEAGDSSQETPV